ncbi:insulin-like growth factor 1 receptor isoform X2 [Corticium candelabrum]|nr:insulin-like growth factor 1 receptor isoform X2 [Corticium candelabrum]XP_062509557.1 insulin-like growth factor 1 receptor isoform X2 [Corticium candelabrum]
MLEVKEYLTPLTTIVEITSVLMVTGLEEGVESIGQILPNLAVIRGNPAYRAHGFLFGLRVYGNKYLKRVELNKLTHALGENNLVVFWDNRELNFYHTVDWNKISSSRKCALANKIDLGKCSAQCGSGDNRGCWNGSNEGCQTVYNKNKPNCSTDIHGAFRNYSGSECLSFCTVGGMTKCVSCKNFYYNGMCVHECPSNTYKYNNWRCVDRCLNITARFPQSCTNTPTFAFNQSCVMHCPENYTGNHENRTCVTCSRESCEKRCNGGTIRNLTDAKRFEHCVHVNGNLTIETVEGTKENDLENYLGQIKIVEDFVFISHSKLSSLSFLKNLMMIKGRELLFYNSNDIFHLRHALIITNNANLKHIHWQNQEKLCLGGRIDASIVILDNPCLLSQDVETLRHQFPEIVIAQRNSGCDNDMLLVQLLSSMGALMLLTIVIVLCLFRVRRQKRQLEVNCKKYLSIIHQEHPHSLVDYQPDKWEINGEDITLEKELGAGAFGLVYVGRWQKSDSEEPLKVAVKTVQEGASHHDKMEFLHEASVMKCFKSCHIVQLLGIVSQSYDVMVVMEFMTKGDLKSYLRSLEPQSREPFTKETFPLSQDAMLQVAQHIAAGMVYLTDLKFVHRDLAARNCMVTDGLTVKIGDFGLTRDIYDNDYYRKVGQGPLPVRWMPPESLKYGIFSHASDIWSFGVVLWEVATLGTQPYPGMSNEEVYKFVTGGGFINISDIGHMPSEYKLLMERCWLIKPNNRLSFQMILQCIKNTSEEQPQ